MKNLGVSFSLSLSAGLLFIQACTTMELVTTPEHVEPTDAIMIKTKGGNDYQLESWRRDSTGSLAGVGAVTPLPADSIASIRAAKMNHEKTAIALVGAAAGIYGIVVFVDLIRDLGRGIGNTRANAVSTVSNPLR